MDLWSSVMQASQDGTDRVIGAGILKLIEIHLTNLGFDFRIYPLTVQCTYMYLFSLSVPPILQLTLNVVVNLIDVRLPALF